MKKIYLWGYWTKNFGDDLFLAILKSKLKNNVDLILNTEKKYASYYEKLGYQKGICPEAEKLYEEMMSIPLYYSMTDQDVQDVVDAVKKVIEYYRR